MKQIEGYKNFYSITIDGTIWSNERFTKRNNNYYKQKGKWLKFSPNKGGYLHVSLCKNGKRKTKRINRLVAKAFIPNPKNKPAVNHINGIKTDNRVENLEWCTHKENDLHARKLGLINSKGENGGNSKLTWDQVNEIRANHISKDIYKRKPWEKYNIGGTQYYNILKEKYWKKVENNLTIGLKAIKND